MHCLCPILIAFALVGYSYGATKTKCQVVQALRNQNVPDSDLRDWLCLVKHESNYKYDAEGTNSDSKDYGIFQMNSKYSCGKRKGTSSSICWRVNTFGCADSCTCMVGKTTVLMSKVQNTTTAHASSCIS